MADLPPYRDFTFKSRNVKDYISIRRADCLHFPRKKPEIGSVNLVTPISIAATDLQDQEGVEKPSERTNSMEPELYEREYLPLHARRLNQNDIRIAFLMALIGIALVNLVG